MQILDSKTIKKIKYKSVYSSDFTKEQLKDMFNKIKQAHNNEKINQLKREYRNALKNGKIKHTFSLHDKINTVSTYYQTNIFNICLSFLNRIEGRRYILNRLKEKMRHNRNELKKDSINIKTNNNQLYSVKNGLFDVKYYLTTTKLKLQLDLINKTKLPSDENCIGVEIEFLSSLSEKKLKELFCQNNLGQYLYVKYDGSVTITDDDYDYAEFDNDGEIINSDDYNGYEVTILASENEINNVIDKTVSIIRKIGFVNETCGLHVHIDMRNRNYKKCFHNLVMMQDFLYKIANGRSNNSYCKYTKSPDFDSMDNSDRYCGINGQNAYEKFETIEVRILEGTLNKLKINSWINLLISTVNLKYKIGARIDNWSRTKELLKIKDINKYKYIEERVS